MDENSKLVSAKRDRAQSEDPLSSTLRRLKQKREANPSIKPSILA